MSDSLVSYLRSHFGAKLLDVKEAFGEVTIEVSPQDFLSVCGALKDTAVFHFEQLIDLCGVDYLQYGVDEWQTKEASATGFSRAVNLDKKATPGRMKFGDDMEQGFDGKRFASVLHLLSYKNNQRLRVRVYADDNDFPIVPSVVEIWNSANWNERESFDLFGIMYEGHPDLRRILTDYGFVGHPFRKDFPMIGNVEMRYDPELDRVVYEPVSITPRVLVPKVIRPEEKYHVTADSDTEE